MTRKIWIVEYSAEDWSVFTDDPTSDVKLRAGEKLSTWLEEPADLAQAPAPVRVKPLIFSEFTEGGCMGRPHPFQYFITQAHNGKFLCHHDTTWHETLKAAQDHAQADYQRAALEAPDDGVVAELVEALREARLMVNTITMAGKLWDDRACAALAKLGVR